jgi:MraZ protein
MLIGEYRHTLDPKKRLSLPSKLRAQLGTTVILTRGLDNCIFVYPEGSWRDITEKMSHLSLGQANARAFSRFLLSSAEEVAIDNSGRILIPDRLKEFAKLSEKVVIAGVDNRLELWDETAWNTYQDRIEKEADDLAQNLGEIGMI